MVRELDSAATEVLAVFSGLRPSRTGGARVAREDVQLDMTARKGLIVHNYGAGGTGFQAGYGMALDAVQLAEQALQPVRIASSRAHL